MAGRADRGDRPVRHRGGGRGRPHLARARGPAYTLSGPEPLRPAGRVAILGEVLGRPLTFEGQPDGEARAEMSKAMPAGYVAAFFRFCSDGTLDESRVRPDVRAVAAFSSKN